MASLIDPTLLASESAASCPSACVISYADEPNVVPGGHDILIAWNGDSAGSACYVQTLSQVEGYPAGVLNYECGAGEASGWCCRSNSLFESPVALCCPVSSSPMPRMPPPPPSPASAVLLYADQGCGAQASHLGTSFDTVHECLATALQTDGCGDSVMWSPSYSGSWGCRCCTSYGADGGSTNSNWAVWGSATDGVDPIRGYTSYAVGAAQVDNIEEGIGELPGGFGDEAQRLAMNWIGADLQDQVRSFDDFQQEYGDPLRVVLPRDSCKSDAPSCSTPNSMCEKTSCPEFGRCSHYTCVCKLGYVERDGACVLHDEAGLPTLSQGGPFAMIWAGANDLMGPTRMKTAAGIFLDTEACDGVTYKCACPQSAPLCKDNGYCYENKWDRNGDPCSRESDQCQFSSRAEHYCAQQVVERVLRDKRELLDSLYLRGFRNFAVANLPDLGIVPSALQKVKIDETDVPSEFRLNTEVNCRAEDAERICRNGANYYRSMRLSNITVKFNTLLALEMQKWQDAHTDTHVAAVDIYRTFNLMLTNKLLLKDGVVEDYTYPLDVDRSRTIEIPNKPPIRVWESCTDGGFSGLTGYALHPILGSSVCAHQDRAIFWDNVHPTSRAHCYIAYAWHLAIHEQTGKWPEPDVQGFKRMCAATQAWHGKDSELYVRD